MEGTVWDVDEVASVTDGDTLRVYRSRLDQLGDDWYRITEVDPATGDPRSTPIRLVWLDTPEKKKPGWAQARADLQWWVGLRGVEQLRVICYESAGWDRILGDLIDESGNSASQWMMRERGWPLYERGK